MNSISGNPALAACPAPTPSAVNAVLYAWLAAGTFDILAAFAYSVANGGTPAGVLRAVASGLIGKRAVGGGLDVVLLGLALHFAIMFVIASIYWLASRRLSILIHHPALCGPLYGVMVFAVMNLVVLPLSAIVFTPNYSWVSLVIGVITHMLCVGLPIALIVRAFSARTRR